jgi:hypothetical protein
VSIDAMVARACERVPGMVRGVLVLLPEGFLLGGAGDDHMLDLEPLIRSVGRCLTPRVSPPIGGRAGMPLVEYLFVIHDQLVAIQAGRRDPRIALAVVCTREHNITFALTATRLAIAEIEASIDLTAWGL